SQSPLTYRVEDNVYVITPKVEVVETAGNQPEEVKPEPKSRIQKIPLNFADVYDIVQAFGGTIIQSRASQTGMGGGGGGYGGSIDADLVRLNEGPACFLRSMSEDDSPPLKHVFAFQEWLAYPETRVQPVRLALPGLSRWQ